MALIGFDTAVQIMVVGAILVLAVWLDNAYRKRIKQRTVSHEHQSRHPLG